MIARVDTWCVALVLVFAFCQVIGAMCMLPDLLVAEGETLFLEEEMICPMDGAAMCPPSATSSPERQLKHGAVVDVDHWSVVPGALKTFTTSSAEPQWSWSSDFSLVPLSISSSSVLRI